MAKARQPPAEVRRSLLEYALGKPGAHLDHPWGEDVARVGKKVFAFFGMAAGDDLGMTIKLPESQPRAPGPPRRGPSPPGVSASRYGLGDSGWVTVRFSESLPSAMLREWIDESYRAVAPRKSRRDAL
jgi:predicted DNA-binding protein (MmcQ/YjbR family)